MIRFCLSIVLLSGCAPTPYEARTHRGGYSETRLGDNLFRIVFEGNPGITVATASDYALLRSADVALEHGFVFFVITSDPSKVAGGKKTSPTVINTILCFNDRAAAEGTSSPVYDAAVVRKALRTKYALDESQKSTPAPAPSERSTSTNH
jgi:hypothetical protein